MITSRQRDGETMESDKLYFWGSKITADGDCSYEIKRRSLEKKLLLPKIIFITKKIFITKNYYQLSILKSRDTTLPTKLHLVKAMVSPVVECMDVRESKLSAE